MSTHATISFISKKGRKVTIFEHWDGYPEGIGRGLAEILKYEEGFDKLSEWIDKVKISESIEQELDVYDCIEDKPSTIMDGSRYGFVPYHYEINLIEGFIGAYLNKDVINSYGKLGIGRLLLDDIYSDDCVNTFINNSEDNAGKFMEKFW